MTLLKLHEQIQRGSLDFPLDYHYVDRYHSRYEMPYHWHNEHEILHVLSGTFHLQMEEKESVLHEGDILFVAPGKLHGGVPENCVYECVVFDMRLLLKCTDECRKWIWDVLHRQVCVNPIFLKGDSITQQTLLPMFDALRSQSAGASLITLGCLYLFLGMIYKNGAYSRFSADIPLQNKRPVQMKTVFEKIEKEYAEPLTLSDLAATVHMSPKYFCRIFKEATHCTPMNYLNYYRIELACHAMAVTRKNVTEIAFEVGFSDVNYFIRTFKKIKGVTPKRYMKMLNAKL